MKVRFKIHIVDINKEINESEYYEFLIERKIEGRILI